MFSIQFCGAARTVTGSAHLITLDNGYKILLDCGLMQGGQLNTDEWNRSWIFNPADIDVLLLSHAHIDHCGRIPKLVHDGFNGKIYCTPATRDLAEIMLLDSAAIQERDTEYDNRRRRQNGLPPLEPLYTTSDVQAALHRFQMVDYENYFNIGKDISFMFRDNGHILGSASITLKLRHNDGSEVTIGFTGDVGRPDRPILRDPKPMPQLDYLISESTYGGRHHQNTPEDLNALQHIVYETCIKKRGKLIIPAFSLGRTQEIVYMLDKLHHSRNLPQVPVFVDSPLSTNATEIYRNHPECFDKELLEYTQHNEDPFGFNSLTYITQVEESKRLNQLKTPCIIIAASGMAEAGRIVHHLNNNVEDPRNTILIVGYCAENTLGARLRKRPEKVTIFGEEKNLRADIEVMDSFSAHGDQEEILKFLSNQSRRRLREIFLVHGEYDSQVVFAHALREEGFKKIAIPAMGETIRLGS